MTKPRLTKSGLLWTCRAPLRPGLGIGLTPADAYRGWLLDAQRPHFSPGHLPRLVPMHEPVAPWPAFNPPLFGPGVPVHRHTGAEPWAPPPYTVTCRH